MDVKTIISLSEREEAFVIGLAKGLKPTRAAVAAGYSAASARPLLGKPHLAGAVRSITANMNAIVARYMTAA
jgi:phage terminase small subunit